MEPYNRYTMNPYGSWAATVCRQLAVWGYTETAERITQLFNNRDSRLYSIYLTSVNSPGIDAMTIKDMIDNI